MSAFQSLVIAVVVIAVVLVLVFVVDWGPPPTDQPQPLVESVPTPIASAKAPQLTTEQLEALTNELMAVYEYPNSSDEPVVLVDVPANIRDIERSRGPRRPTVEKRKPWGFAWPYDSILRGRISGGVLPRAKPAEPMPPTPCRSVRPAPKCADRFSGPYYVHDHAVREFGNESGFGFFRMTGYNNKRGIEVAPHVDRLELVSLLTNDEPAVYVLDEMVTPPLARQAKRRSLDQFERLGLDAVRRGEHLVWSPEAPKRMFGAVRARTQCLECHVNAKRGELLGAFTYYLEVPVDQLAKPDSE